MPRNPFNNPSAPETDLLEQAKNLLAQAKEAQKSAEAIIRQITTGDASQEESIRKQLGISKEDWDKI